MASGSYDGKVTISTELDNDQTIKDVKALRQGLLQSMKTITDTINRGFKSTETASNRAAQTARRNAENTMVKMEQIQRRMQEIEQQEMGGAATSTAFENARISAEKYNAELDVVNDKLGAMRDAVKNNLAEFYKGDSTGLNKAVEATLAQDKAYQKLVGEADKLNARVDEYTAKMESAKAATVGATGTQGKEYQRLGNQLEGLSVKYRQYSEQAQQAGKETEKTTKKMKKIDGVSVPLSKSIFRLGNMFKLMAIRMVMRSAINAVRQGFQDLAKYSKNFNATMTELSTSFLYVRNALVTALAPAMQFIGPVVSQVADAFARLLSFVSALSARIFTNATTFTKAKKAVKDFAGEAGKAAQSLASFDDLNILSKDAGAGAVDPSEMFEEAAIEGEVLSLADRIKGILADMWAPLKEIDLGPVIAAFGRLKAALAPLGKKLFAGLEWGYRNVLVPLATWTVEQAAPAMLDVLSAALGVLDSVLGAVAPGLEWLYFKLLQPIGAWAGETFLWALGLITEALQGISAWITKNKEPINAFITGIGEIFVFMWEHVLKPHLNAVRAFIELTMRAVGGIIAELADNILLILNGIITFVTGVFTGDWEKAWQGIKMIFLGAWNGIVGLLEGAVNLVIDGINFMIDAIVSKINAMIESINRAAAKLGLSTIPLINAPQLGHITLPRLPALAQGAVIPPNREFLAVLGDQRSGVNIETPLETMLEAFRTALAESRSQSGDIVLQVDGKTFARLIGPYQNAEARRRGPTLIPGVV